MRLDRIVARTLGLSRSEAAARFAAGRVTDGNGQVLRGDQPGRFGETVQLDGVAVELPEHVHVLLHKPVGCVTALSDPMHPVAASFVTGAPCAADLRPIGRLDADTSGVLLWTTDGARVQRWAHPKRAVPRTYHAALSRPFTMPSGPVVLRDGTVPDLVEVRPIAVAHAALVLPQAQQSGVVLATITIRSGSYHEVKRTFAALGSEVIGLCRVQFGPFVLPDDLAPGAWTAIDLPAQYDAIA